ncbi:hypothetical protein, partial [Vibrio parahaemolyticus]|uniref:hypothetical protein n=1 Tax=Vibrio parahaemolyticus TaxID=670 RepID=UPI002111820B
IAGTPSSLQDLQNRAKSWPGFASRIVWTCTFVMWHSGQWHRLGMLSGSQRPIGWKPLIDWETTMTPKPSRTALGAVN